MFSPAVAKITNFQDYWKVSAKIICATGLAFTHDSTYPMIHCSTSLDGQMKLRTQVVFGRRGTVEWPDQTIVSNHGTCVDWLYDYVRILIMYTCRIVRICVLVCE